jgi:predicted glycogen debranching enzyme
VRFERGFCLQLDAALTRRWIETDGLGGYASSTLLGCPTSRFDGLLVVVPDGSAHRHTFLSRFEETLYAEGREFAISNARYRHALSPDGYRFLDHCEFDGRPRFVYRIGHVVVEREVLVPQGVQGVLVRYRVTGQGIPIELRLRPFLPYRRADSLTYVNDVLDPRVLDLPNGIAARPYTALPPVALTTDHPEAEFVLDGQWYRDLQYDDDLARGYDGFEEQFSPGGFRVALESGEAIVVAATIDEPIADPAAAWAAESERRERELPTGEGIGPALERAAPAFLYRTAEGRPGVIAGYPWFNEWGRDTFIALPGLTLGRGRVEECGDVLSGALPFLRGGRFPNVFGLEPDSSDYKAIDPPFWFARAVELYDKAGGSEERLLDELLPALLDIATFHRGAKAAEIAADDAGLLRAGTPGVATTWMDAVIDGTPVTPRDGYQVEVNALWYALVAHLARLLKRKGDNAGHKDWTAFRKRLGARFLERLWLPDRNRLADRWVDGGPDDTVRPNMVIAAALESSPLSKEQRKSIVEFARTELLTPRCLRTLSPRYLAYRSRYEGDVGSRDSAYHQGTVWPWLLGYYVEACVRAHGRAKAVTAPLRELLDGFLPHLDEHGVGQISEVFDGDPPHRPGGAFAQAWSVAELLRANRLLRGGRKR